MCVSVCRSHVWTNMSDQTVNGHKKLRYQPPLPQTKEEAKCDHITIAIFPSLPASLQTDGNEHT
jgi:hypothetical protein